jgi:hypothetical protein
MVELRKGPYGASSMQRPEEVDMYIGIGTALVIIVLILILL